MAGFWHPSGTLIIGKTTAGHWNMAKGQNVIAAGEFKTKGRQVVKVNNKSGHYLPHGANAEQAAIDAFNKNGLDADGKYIQEWAPPCR
jgi:hypothetical protein